MDDEYMDKAAFIAHIKKEAQGLRTKMPLDMVVDSVANEAKVFPAADVAPVRHGRWRLYSPLTDTYECDKCGYQVIDESFRTNYCPNCGARLDLEGDKG